MPKMKSSRGAAKRIRFTGTGKPRHGKAFGSHLMRRKSRKQKRRLRKSNLVDAADLGRIQILLPGKR